MYNKRKVLEDLFYMIVSVKLYPKNLHPNFGRKSSMFGQIQVAKVNSAELLTALPIVSPM